MNIDRVSWNARQVHSRQPSSNRVPDNYGSGGLIKDIGNVQIKEKMCISKIEACCLLFDFGDSLAMLREKEIKRAFLTEIVDFCASHDKHSFGEPFFLAAFNMIRQNIFRDLPPCEYYNGIDIETWENFVEVAWPHLELVYQFFLQLLNLKNLKGNRKIINKAFVTKVLALLDSCDSRERAYLEEIIQKIYYKFLWIRSHVVKQIQDVLSEFLCDGERFHGVAEILSAYTNFAGGFVNPLKPHNFDFAVTMLFPLHKTKSLPLFHRQLAECVITFVKKDRRLLPLLLDYLITHFPCRDSRRGTYFVREVSALLSQFDAALPQQLQTRLFQLWGRCIEDPHIHISQSTLLTVREDWMARIIRKNFRDSFSHLVPALYRTSLSHWSHHVKMLTLMTIRFLRELNYALFVQFIPAK